MLNAILFELYKNANAFDDDETQVSDEDESQGNSVPSSEGTQQVVTGLIALRCNQTWLCAQYFGIATCSQKL